MKRHAGAERTHGFLFKKRGHVYAEYLRETTLQRIDRGLTNMVMDRYTLTIV